MFSSAMDFGTPEPAILGHRVVSTPSILTLILLVLTNQNVGLDGSILSGPHQR